MNAAVTPSEPMRRGLPPLLEQAIDEFACTPVHSPASAHDHESPDGLEIVDQDTAAIIGHRRDRWRRNRLLPGSQD